MNVGVIGINSNRGLAKLNNIPKNQVNFGKNISDGQSSTAKKWGVGLASFCVTGLGQLINGEVKKAATMFFGSIALALSSMAILKFNKNLGSIIAFGSLALPIYSIVDAVKNVKPSSQK